MFTKLLQRLDRLLCLYFGLEKEEIKPSAVRKDFKDSANLWLISSSSFKRHAIKESWHDFHALSMGKTVAEDRKKLGMAIGKIIAKNLVVSFEQEENKK